VTVPHATLDHSRPSLIRDASFIRLCLAQTISTFGAKVFSIAIPVWILADRAEGPAALGALFAARTTATSLLLMVGGVLSDRVPRKVLMVGAELVLSATVATLAFLPSDVPFAAILILFIVAGGADAFFTPASQSLLFDLAGADRLESANAISTLLVRVTGLIGPAFGGLLVVAIGIHTALLIHSSTSLISAVAVASTRHVVAARSVAPMNARALWRDASEGIRATMTTGWLRAVLLSDLSQTLFAVAPWFVLLPITLVPQGAADYAVAVAAFAAGGLLGALTPLKWQPRAIGRAALLAQALFALPLVALALHAPLPLLAATVVIGGYGADLGAVLFVTGLQRGVPREMLGRITALSYLGSVALLPAGFALAGALALPVGVEPILLTGVAVIATATSLALRTSGVAYMGTRPQPPLTNRAS